MAADHQNTTDPSGVPCEEIIVYLANWLVCGVQVHFKASAEEQGVGWESPTEKREQALGYLRTTDKNHVVTW